MSAWRWELRHWHTGVRVDRATRLWILRRASVPVIYATGFDKKHTYTAVHIASGRQVGHMAGTSAWRIDDQLVAQLEPDEARSVGV